ncbi:hypothetical protein R3X25_09300 [Lutibacter sp. TH_r2]|uniref:hypothetical protein n=1 Tax=Lutibacter sp. TH_r2 TaxID=3082083 RepID=UPI002954C2A8|nr:hypothetical protein [Lutibacter sp. TH_r2]MDV7187476.1 hypothetical protein [Lutibacter sp. TH_r2]
MSSITQVVNLVEEKLKNLIDNYSFLKEENDFLLKKVAILEQEKAKEILHYKELEKKYQTLKIAKTIEGSKKDSRETKLKINALIREIDVCINQLSE